MIKNIVLLSLFILSFRSYAVDSPREIYEDYEKNQKLGMTFNKIYSYYSKSNKKRNEEILSTYASQMKMTREEVIEFFLPSLKVEAKCEETKFVTQEIDGSIALLEYELTNICEELSEGEGKLLIRLINENGWKIDKMDSYD
ncbi:hypothetical protein [Pseudocolwellia agarivorans]|uniref:hypothetical protein n=1 Tax=Pseudocolwellia agarivorans TaxID=1911682 RepID=UPI0009868F43|nr:hypothetical protein [Pseudocolwellia agarivorans]